MKPFPYKAKLLLNFTGLFAVFAIALVLFQQHREQAYRKELLETRLRSYADLVAGGIEKNGLDNDSAELAKLSDIMPDDLRLTVIAPNGSIRYETAGMPPGTMSDHKNRPEVKDARRRGEGCDIRQSESTGAPYFYFARQYGSFIVRVALPYDDTVKDFMKADKIFQWFVLLIFPIALVMLIYISDRFGKAVAGLRRFVDSAERGLIDYDHISFPRSELGDIAQAVMQKYRQQEEDARQIATERERLMRHFHYFKEGIAIFTADRTRLYANPRFMQYVNTLLEEPTADIGTIWQKPQFAPVAEFLALNVPHAASEAPVLRYTLTAGSTCYGLQALVYNDGGFELTLTDITQAEKSRLLKQQMSNNITHELRTPVSSVRGYLETLMACPGMPEERRRHFEERAYRQTIRLADLIRDVALITKTEEAPDMMPREDIAVSRLVDDILEELQPAVAEAQATVSNQLPADLTIHGNYSLLHAVFRNLLENSLHHAGHGVLIHMECYSRTDGYAYLRYYDTGSGVPGEHLPRLFERFYRTGEGRTRNCGGTGLGLSIVRNAVRFHGGDISVRNRKEGGLEFLFTLRLQ